MTHAKTPEPIKTYKPSAQSGAQTFGICIYGKGGAGKTTLIGTMPGNGLVIDIPQIEGGTFVLEDVADHIDVTSVERWEDIEKVYWYLANGDHKYRWVAIDSLTAMTELATRKTIRERTLSEDPHQVTLQEWGKIGRLVGELIYRFRTLPVHTIWTAQERTHGNENDSRLLGPNTTPAALTYLIPSMMLVGRLYVEQGENGWERRLRIGPSEHFYTKTRARPGIDVPAVVRNPRLDVLLKFLLSNGERPEEVDESSIILSM